MSRLRLSRGMFHVEHRRSSYRGAGEVDWRDQRTRRPRDRGTGRSAVTFQPSATSVYDSAVNRSRSPPDAIRSMATGSIRALASTARIATTSKVVVGGRL